MAQEEWHARSNLTFSLALRADHQSNPVCENRCFARLSGPFDPVSHDPDQPYNQAILMNQKQAFPNTDPIVWSPRFSFAWQPFDVFHNTVLRGGIGLFYDPLPGGIATGLSSNSPLFNNYTLTGYSLAPSETNSLSQNASASNAAFMKGFATGQTFGQIQAANPNFTPPELSDSPQHTPFAAISEMGFASAAKLRCFDILDDRLFWQSRYP